MVRIRDWKVQAQETLESTRRKAFRSFSLYAETRLKEAVGLFPEQDCSTPHRHVLAVCCQILHELSNSLGSFSEIFQTVFEMMVRAIYCDECASVEGGLTFDQIPYFEMAQHLKDEANQLVEEKIQLEKQLLEGEQILKAQSDELSALKRSSGELKKKTEGLEEALLDSTRVQDQLRMESDLIKEEMITLRVENKQQKMIIETLYQEKESLEASARQLDESFRLEKSIKVEEAKDDKDSQGRAEDRMEKGVQVENPPLEDGKSPSVEIPCWESLLSAECPPQSIDLNEENQKTAVELQDLPRLFRLPPLHPATELTPEETEEVVWSILQTRRQFEAVNGPISLHAYTFHYFTKSKNVLREGMAYGWDFFKACDKHSNFSPLIEGCWQVLQGHISEASLQALQDYEESVNCLIDQFLTFPINQSEDWKANIVQGLQIFNPLINSDEMLSSLNGITELSSTRLEILNRMEFEFLEMCRQCLSSLMFHLKDKSILEDSSWLLHVDDMKDVVMTADLNQPERILLNLQDHIARSFGEKEERIPLNFVKEILRTQTLLTYPDYQNLEQAIALYEIIRNKDNKTIDSLKSLPDMA